MTTTETNLTQLDEALDTVECQNTRLLDLQEQIARLQDKESKLRLDAQANFGHAIDLALEQGEAGEEHFNDRMGFYPEKG